MKRPLISAARLRQVLRYDRDAGEFVWRTSLSRSVPAGSTLRRDLNVTRAAR
jgi:hypothetical protein